MSTQRKTIFWLSITLSLLLGYFVGWKLPLVAKVTRPSPQTVAYENQMRRLWQTQAFWVRNYLIEMPSQDASITTLLKNQEDLGNSLKPYFDNTTGDRFAAILKDNLSFTMQYINASKTGKPLTRITQTWIANDDKMLAFLTGLNPNLDQKLMTTLWKNYQISTRQEIAAHFQKNTGSEIGSYSQSYDGIVLFSDSLASAFEKQFPERF